MTDKDASCRHGRWEHHLEEIDREIAQLALVCNVPLLDPGVIERVLANDTLVCGTRTRVPSRTCGAC